MFSKPPNHPKPPPQTEFRYNSKFIRHKKHAQPQSTPRIPPNTIKLNLKITKNILNLAKCDSTQGN